ncbi:MAG: TIM barrel protein [Acidimicrobiales bacterium]
MEIAAEAGFSRVELWLPSIHAYVDAGGSLDDFRRRVDDLGIVVENGIRFAAWIVDDDDLRRAGLETARRDMEALATIGCRRIAAPPVGAVEGPVVATERIVERFDALATLGASFDVTPQLEL